MEANSSRLPILPSGNGGIQNLFRRILLAYLVAALDDTGNIRVSQRELASTFNRSGQYGIGKHLRAISKSGYLFKVHPSTGVLPDTYRLGSRLAVPSTEYTYFSQLSKALFNVGGLLAVPGWNEALGVGCLNESGMLVLGTFATNCDPLSTGCLTRYLKDYVSSRSVSRTLRALESAGITQKSLGLNSLTTQWQERFTGLLAASSACCPRKNLGDLRRKSEQQLNLSRLNRGWLTDAERTYLRSQKCVYCDANGVQQQHFPPRRFLADYEIVNNRHFIWPVCQPCNDAEKNFIRSLPRLPRLDFVCVGSSDIQTTDLLALYRMESERSLKIFHSAHLQNNETKAYREVVRCHVLWRCIEVLGATDESDRFDPGHHLLRFEDTLRVPLRLRRSHPAQSIKSVNAWLRAVVQLDGVLVEMSYGNPTVDYQSLGAVAS